MAEFLGSLRRKYGNGSDSNSLRNSKRKRCARNILGCNNLYCDFVTHADRWFSCALQVFYGSNCSLECLVAVCFVAIGTFFSSWTWQKRSVLSDVTLPEEFKLALAESLQHGIFSSVWARSQNIINWELVFLISLQGHTNLFWYLFLNLSIAASFPGQSCRAGASCLCSGGKKNNLQSFRKVTILQGIC